MKFHNLYSVSELQEQFGPISGFAGGIARAERDLVGDTYLQALAELTTIINHQWQAGIRRSAVKGFFLSGPPGVGKTTLVRRVAYELCHRFRSTSDDAPDSHVLLLLVDGGEIARARYGESEERIREVFDRAQRGFESPGQYSVILFDDVESILMARGSNNAKEWHFSQDSVFFHAVDELDTSRAVVFLTSNRPDLVDAAIVDRFLTYTFGAPSGELLIEVAVRCAREQQLDGHQTGLLVERIRRAVDDGSLRSIREVERLAVRQYVEGLLGRPSTAHIGAAESIDGPASDALGSVDGSIRRAGDPR